MGSGAKLDSDLAGAAGEVLACSKIKRHARPAPIIYEKLDGNVGLDVRIRFYLWLLPVPRTLFAIHRTGEILASDNLPGDIFGAQGANGFEQLDFFIADR